MAKTKISEFSATAANNTDITNINIAEGCSPANVNNSIRSLMALLKDQQDGTSGDPFTVSGALTASGTLTSSGTIDITGGFKLDGAAGTAGQALVSAGSNTPTWSTLGTMAAQNATAVAITGGTITGITDLTVEDGGTGASSITANSVILGNGTSALSGNLVAPSTSGNVLTSNGTTWLSQAFGVRIKSITFNSSSSAYSNATASATDMITVTVTPASASSKFFVVGSTSLLCTGGAGNGCIVNLVKDSTIIFSQNSGHGLNNNFNATSSPAVVDSPATTSPITYRVSAVRSGASSISSNTFHYSITVVEFE
jgi:hypothetical protein